MDFDWMYYVKQIVDICLIPLLGILTAFLIQFIKAKVAQYKQQTDSELASKYLSMLEDTIISCVIATNQTYTEALKKENAFTKEAQQEAFRLTYTAIFNILSQDAVDYLSEMLGDLSLYVTERIEAEVNGNKKEELTPAE